MSTADALSWVTSELTRLVEIPSPSGEEGAIVAYLRERLTALELPWRAVPTPGGNDNLVVGSSAPDLVIVAHMDTIRPTWPWSGRAEVREGELWGLGAVDDKGGVVAALFALLLAREAGIEPARSGVAAVLTVDEERSGTGSMAVAGALRPGSALVLEGTGLAPGVAEAGVVAGSVVVRGRSTHGALPEFGDSAILKAARLILELDEAAFTGNQHPLLGAAMPCVEELRAGSDLYAVPDRAWLRLDIRVVPGVTAAEVVAQTEDVCARHDASLEVEEAVDAFETPSRSPLLAALNAATQRVTGARRLPVGVRAWTDAHNFAAAAADTLVFGPGRLIGSAHQPDERVAVEDVLTAARILADLIARRGQSDLE